MVTRSCVQCGASFQTHEAWIRKRPNHHGRYCSRACANIAQRGRKQPNTAPPEERFWRFVNKTASCWEWTGYLTADGYARFGKLGSAHRWIWQQLNGPVPKGLEIHHECVNRRCVNPAHLELVTHDENVRRGGNAQKTHCPQGHPYSGDNLYIERYGGRRCRICRAENIRRHRERKALEPRSTFLLS